MSSEVESFLCIYLQTTHFSIQLDESTLPGNEALLLAYVRFVMGEEIHEELLFAKTLKTDTKVNKIRSNALNMRLFAQLCDENEETSNDCCYIPKYAGCRKVECLDEDIQTYVQHLIALYDDFKFGFEDILSMEIPPWIINPFDEMEVDNVILQEELLELSSDEELKLTFKREYQKFWL
ncbi:hypothetical protein EVAR_82380_1 [Eumeta japonica]|uniref:SCAN domain-containing protein 3 n=1 Tax=Eumeta variegata TaxID=151549 RepID=A0A4C1U9X7_EUMVA|nr:hypothetical protein EVAR_82380_1 [Eumeta japonica]